VTTALERCDILHGNVWRGAEERWCCCQMEDIPHKITRAAFARTRWGQVRKRRVEIRDHTRSREWWTPTVSIFDKTPPFIIKIILEHAKSCPGASQSYARMVVCFQCCVVQAINLGLLLVRHASLSRIRRILANVKVLTSFSQ
jgi:hypothetical protein